MALFKPEGLAYIESDHLNTPRSIIDPTRNAAIWRWDLTGDAFGAHAANDDADGDGVRYNFNLRYPGQYFDAESGLHYNYFRDYEPQTGRYVESDPIGFAGGVSTYGYVGGSPFIFFDKQGLSETCGQCANEDCLLYGGNVCGNGPQGAFPPSDSNTSIEIGVRPFDPVQLPVVRHCLLRFRGDVSDTLSFDVDGTHPDPVPSNASYTGTQAGPEDVECVKRKFKECKDYHFVKNNCCDCVADALKACGIPWPNTLDPNPIVEPGTNK